MSKVPIIIDKFTKYCSFCNKAINPYILTNVTEIRQGTIQFGIFNRAFNYPNIYVHDECMEDYITLRVKRRNDYAFDSDKGNPS